MIQSLANFLRRRQQKWNSGQMLSILAHSSLEVHCSYRLKFFVAKNHLRSSSPSNCSLLCSRFARSCSPRPSQRSQYTEGAALRMRIRIAVRRLSRKCVQKKIRAGGFSHYVIILLSEHDHKNSCCRTVIYTFSNKGIINIV